MPWLLFERVLQTPVDPLLKGVFVFSPLGMVFLNMCQVHINGH